MSFDILKILAAVLKLCVSLVWMLLVELLLFRLYDRRDKPKVATNKPPLKRVLVEKSPMKKIIVDNKTRSVVL